MRTGTIILALALASARVASSQDYSGKLGPKLSGPVYGAEATYSLKNDWNHVFAETPYRPDPEPNWGLLHKLFGDTGDPYGSPDEIRGWVKDLAVARSFGVPTIDATGPVKANGRVGMILPRRDVVTVIPHGSSPEQNLRYDDYANPEVTTADLDAIENGLKKARAGGYNFALDQLEIDPSGHVRVSPVRVLQRKSGGGGLPLPLSPEEKTRLSGMVGDEQKMIATLRAEVKNVQVISQELQSRGIEKDPKKANALAANMAAWIANPKYDGFNEFYEYLGYENEKLVQDLALKLRSPEHQDRSMVPASAGEDNIIKVIRGALGLALAQCNHGPIVGGVTVTSHDQGKTLTESFRFHGDGTVEFDTSGSSTHEKGTYVYAPSAPETKRLEDDMKKLRSLPAPTKADKTIPPGGDEVTIESTDDQGKLRTYKVNLKYALANPDKLDDLMKLSGDITHRLTPGMLSVLDRNIR
jgi:hypothetical protein